jgi:hypothetical protein
MNLFSVEGKKDLKLRKRNVFVWDDEICYEVICGIFELWMLNIQLRTQKTVQYKMSTSTAPHSLFFIGFQNWGH